MARFIKGNELNSEIEKIIYEAEKQLILISPYIKLHDRYSAALLTKLKDPDLEITILFGKNESDFSKSMKQNDFDFFKQFPNIEILHEKRLHAKYYANERKAILTSMNLYGYSQNNNIEAGVLMEGSFKAKILGSNSIDIHSLEYFEVVREQAEILFERRPTFEKKGFLGARKYISSDINIDILSDFFANKKYKRVTKKETRKDNPPQIKQTEKETDRKIGYCIRKGEEIPFNIEKPLSNDAYKSWNKYKDENYPEKYCHFSGEPSSGKTCMKKPILAKNWKEAKATHNL